MSDCSLQAHHQLTFIAFLIIFIPYHFVMDLIFMHFWCLFKVAPPSSSSRRRLSFSFLWVHSRRYLIMIGNIVDLYPLYFMSSALLHVSPVRLINAHLSSIQHAISLILLLLACYLLERCLVYLLLCDNKQCTLERVLNSGACLVPPSWSWVAVHAFSLRGWATC